MLQKLKYDIDFVDVVQWIQLVSDTQLVMEDEMQSREDVRWAVKG